MTCNVCVRKRERGGGKGGGGGGARECERERGRGGEREREREREPYVQIGRSIDRLEVCAYAVHQCIYASIPNTHYAAHLHVKKARSRLSQPLR